MYIIIFLVVVVVAAWAVKNKMDSNTYKNVGVDEFEQIIAQKDSVTLLDVRTLSEYHEAHIPNAMLIDMKTDSFLTAARQQIPHDKKVAVYCRSGRRSASAAVKLAKEGYTVINLDGGILAWMSAGKLVEQ